MLRKILVLSLVQIYSLSVIGLPLHFHYCKGELQHISLLIKTGCHGADQHDLHQDCCKVTALTCCTATLTSKQCCDDSTQWLHEDILATASLYAYTNLNSSGINLTLTNIWSGEEQIEAGVPGIDIQTASDADRPLYLMHCAFIYYG